MFLYQIIIQPLIMAFKSLFIGGVYVNNDDVMDFKEMIDVVALSQNKSKLSALTSIYNNISDVDNNLNKKEVLHNFLKLKLAVVKHRIHQYERTNNINNIAYPLTCNLNNVYQYLQWKYERTDIEKMINLHNYNTTADSAPEVRLLNKSQQTNCLICNRNVYKICTVSTNCGHSFCKGCFQVWCSKNKAFKCPHCKVWYPRFVKFTEPDPHFKCSFIIKKNAA
jgi:hypothetical protein